ncbi:dimodular nonribosomal peptide synthase [Abditibacteriota bacterium]|nr:dimodular nonribosomal peptide synthase [Abditibacteriota bacterium]
MLLENSSPTERLSSEREPISTTAIQEWLVTHIAAICEVSDEEIDVNSPITSFGLESLTLFTLAGDLASWLDRDIPATLLWEYPNIAEIAKYLGQSSLGPADVPEAPRHASLVTIQPHGEVPPLFLVHDVSGALWCYTAMMRHMGTDQPVYGFQIPVSENEPFAVPTLEELAALYVNELRRKHPQGPYRLGGFSLGGVIAFEMARQLREAGQEIALLALMDTNFPGMKHPKPSFSHRVRIHVRNFWHSNHREKGLYILERYVPSLIRSFYFHSRHLQPLKPSAKWHYLRNLLTRRPNAESRGSASERQRFREALLNSDVKTQLQRVASAYRPLPYDGRITLLRARWQLTLDDDRRAWRRVALKGTYQKLSSGTHGILIAEPHVRPLAANLKQCLREVESLKEH